jgi:hypothetical protein
VPPYRQFQTAEDRFVRPARELRDGATSLHDLNDGDRQRCAPAPSFGQLAGLFGGPGPVNDPDCSSGHPGRTGMGTRIRIEDRVRIDERLRIDQRLRIE